MRVLLIYIISHCYIGHYDDCCLERGGDRTHQKYFQCRGTEQELSQCDSYDMTLQPRHRYVAEIYCNGTYNVHVYGNDPVWIHYLVATIRLTL